jgi:hypothetical protein
LRLVTARTFGLQSGCAFFDRRTDFKDFLAMFGKQVSEPGKLYFLKKANGIKLYSGWARGNEKFLRA